jgi:hypothetical protein
MASRNEEEAPRRTATRRGTSSRSDESREAPRRDASRRSSSGSDEAREEPRERPPRKKTSEGSGSRDSEITSVRAAQAAVVQLHELTTRDIEAVVGMSKKDDGNWNVIIEVVEAHHFPDTSDVMAEYSVDVDTQGELVGYSRGQRYLRGRPGGQ